MIIYPAFDVFIQHLMCTVTSREQNDTQCLVKFMIIIDSWGITVCDWTDQLYCHLRYNLKCYDRPLYMINTCVLLSSNFSAELRCYRVVSHSLINSRYYFCAYIHDAYSIVCFQVCIVFIIVLFLFISWFLLLLPPPFIYSIFHLCLRNFAIDLYSHWVWFYIEMLSSENMCRLLQNYH